MAVMLSEWEMLFCSAKNLSNRLTVMMWLPKYAQIFSAHLNRICFCVDIPSVNDHPCAVKITFVPNDRAARRPIMPAFDEWHDTMSGFNFFKIRRVCKNAFKS